MEPQTERHDAWDKVCEIIENDRQDLVELCLKLAGIISPPGKEMECAKAVVEWFETNGINAYLQPITEDSANAIGLLPGSSDGRSLVWDAHIDQEIIPGATSELAKRMLTGWVEGEMIYGTSIVNCKAQVAAFMIAARAFKKAGIRLKGDLAIAAVASETGWASVDEFQGINYPGAGMGSRWLIDRGVTADYALIGETSQFGIVGAECGYVQLKIRVRGRAIYTPRIERGKTWQENPNAFVKAAHVALALEEWAISYEQKEQFRFWGGLMVPKSQIIGMRGGRWGELGRGACDIYLDVWIVPGANPRAIKKDIQSHIQKLGIDCEVTIFQWGRGHIAENAGVLIDAVKDAHRYVFDDEPVNPPSHAISMWRDLNAFNEVGIPSVCYGPSRQKEFFSDAQNRAMKISDLVAATKVYAITAMSICGTDVE
jgi:acetylornithine deacetylase